MSDICVVAMGGNSLVDPSLPPSVQNQFMVTAHAVEHIAELAERSAPLVITHGNGPQVGYMQLRSELARDTIHEVPLDSLVADSQGSIGYMIQLSLREELARRGVTREVITLVTEVEVSPEDPAFDNPTKPIGRFYSEEKAKVMIRDRQWQMVEDAHRGYRRVVPSPIPTGIVQLEAIRRLTLEGTVVVACGGGGIPVMTDDNGNMKGLEAVIDKDRATALLANGLGSRRLLITTGVDAIYKGFLGSRPTPIRQATISQMRALAAAGEFPPGSMGPKVDASIQFLENGGEEVIICTPDDLSRAFEGDAGTRIVHD